jgi:hypothetical protein
LTEAGHLPTVDRLVAVIEDSQTKNVLLKLDTLSVSADLDAEERLAKALQGYRSRRLRTLATWFDDAAAVLARRVGDGIVVVIGDTEFALNKNLAYLPQDLFNGPYNNAHFWRWLLTDLRGPQAWIPPAAEEDEEPAEWPEDSPAGVGQAGGRREEAPASDPPDAAESRGQEVTQ